MLSKYSHQKKKHNANFETPKTSSSHAYITIPLEYPIENRYKVTRTPQQTPQGKLKGVLHGGTAPPPGILTILIHRPSPWPSFTGVGMVAGFAMSGLSTQILQKNDRKCPLVIPYTLVRRP